MTNPFRAVRAGTTAFLLTFVTFGAVACASAEPSAVLQVGTRNLKCSQRDVVVELNRTTPKVREYVVGCDFMYTRVQCTSAECHPAPVQPPCIGDLPCFEEDPVTLEWRLSSKAVARR